MVNNTEVHRALPPSINDDVCISHGTAVSASPFFIYFPGLVRKNLSSIPVFDDETDSDAIDVVVVIEHTLAVTVKVLNVSADSHKERKGPF